MKRGEGGWKGKRKREIGEGKEEKKEEKERRKKKDSRILETKSRVVGWSNNRAALNTVIPAMLVKRGKKPVEKAARVRPKLSLSFSLLSVS